MFFYRLSIIKTNYYVQYARNIILTTIILLKTSYKSVYNIYSCLYIHCCWPSTTLWWLEYITISLWWRNNNLQRVVSCHKIKLKLLIFIFFFIELSLLYAGGLHFNICRTSSLSIRLQSTFTYLNTSHFLSVSPCVVHRSYETRTIRVVKTK